MITRAQAEALLTLAESLEACERVGVTIEQDYEDASVCYSGRSCQVISSINARSVRAAVAELMPKHTGS